ncbi:MULTISPECIES: hypothetical protein [Caballeronia]|uniref:hypothetical protein n=1 Tax=Caballeronia TaxID=1827195 RepID=UPI001FD1F796|nr:MULTISPECIES: hypothetical protein [Caballeronia]MDR5799019.1 hypothetical protein [Caballeronia sp. LZ001]
MAKDDFIRIKYSREVDGRKKRTSVSVDPDLFQIFAKIRGSVPAARTVLRQWAAEIDGDRQWSEGLGSDGGIGSSRLVQRRMFAEINEFVDKGMIVVRQEEVERHPNAPRPDVRASKKRTRDKRTFAMA